MYIVFWLHHVTTDRISLLGFLKSVRPKCSICSLRSLPFIKKILQEIMMYSSRTMTQIYYPA